MPLAFPPLSARRVALVLAGLLALLAATGRGADRPNLIFIIGDDISWDDFGCYGNPAARTPHTDRLARGGIRFTNAYLTASSCSPSRNSFSTGRYPHNNGAGSELHRPVAGHLVRFPALLRTSGYYTVLSGKNHMPQEKPAAGEPEPPAPFDVIDDGQVPGNHGGHGRWVEHLRNRPKDRPFFGWFAALDAHRAWDGDAEWDAAAYGPKHDPARVRVPPFLVDDAATREDLASHANEVTRFDHFVGRVVAELERQGMLQNTLLFVTADNGRPFPRAKTRLHDSGMKAPLVVHWPAGIRQPGTPRTGLVSAIDVGPTVLAAAGARLPDSFQGVSLLPLFTDPAASVRHFAFSEHNWHDYAANARAVRDGEYLYILNLDPAQAWQGPADSVRSPSFASLLAAEAARRLTPAQQEVLLAPRPREELYRTADDPDQLNNLAGDARHAAALNRLREVMTRWRDETADSQPADPSRDGFDRRKGTRLLPARDTSYHRTPAGADRQAHRVNHPGPR
ncbi:MAG: sulfatase [Opitutaceae bacterium]|nr:sulfatase [Opitutaceae bacterium]